MPALASRFQDNLNVVCDQGDEIREQMRNLERAVGATFLTMEVLKSVNEIAGAATTMAAVIVDMTEEDFRRLQRDMRDWLDFP